MVESLGSTFAHVRGDRVIAVDIDGGDLSERHGRRNPLSLADLLLDDSATQYRDIRAHTYMNSFGLEVLGLPDSARTDWRLERHDVVKAFSILRNHYSLVLFDCVKAVNSAVMDAVLPESRALVVVTSTSIDAIRKDQDNAGLVVQKRISATDEVDGACDQSHRAGQAGRRGGGSRSCRTASPPPWCCRSIGTCMKAKRSGWID